MSQNPGKLAASKAALRYVENETIIGVGTGSTITCFIEVLAAARHSLEGAVASSEATAQLLKQYGIPVLEANTTGPLPLYIDSADEVNEQHQLIKGGGGALTREKILAQAAKKFVCIVDSSKVVRVLGSFPLAVEVLPFARSFVGRELVKLGGDPEYREGYKTDNGNIIIDVHNLDVSDPMKLEQKINHIPGVIANGIFALRKADVVLVGSAEGKVTEL